MEETLIQFDSFSTNYTFQINDFSQENKRVHQIKNMKHWNFLSIKLLSFFLGISSISSLSLLIFLKDSLGLQPQQMSIMRLSQGVPWIIYPLYGIIIDRIPIFGLKMKIYFFIISILHFTSWFGLIYFAYYHFIYIYFFTFMLQLSIAFAKVINRVLIIETSRLYKEKEEKTKDYNNKSAMVETIGKLIASLFDGYLSSQNNFKITFLLCASLSILIVFSGIFYIEEIKYEESERISSLTSVISSENSHCKKKNYINYNIFRDFIIQKKIYPSLIFIILYNSLPNSQNVIFYYSMNSLNISVIQMGYMAIMGNIVIIVGMFVYRKWFKHFNWVEMIIMTSIFNFICGIPYILLLFWFNSKINVNNFAVLSMGRCVTVLIEQFSLTPFLFFASVISPKNFVGTGTTIVIMCWRLGATLSEGTSGVLSAILGITSNNFDKLYLFIIIERTSKLVSLICLIWMNLNVREKRKKRKNVMRKRIIK